MTGLSLAGLVALGVAANRIRAAAQVDDRGDAGDAGEAEATETQREQKARKMGGG